MNTKIYFASDVHLGAPDAASSREREKRFVKWLDMVSADATELFLVGDLFDFWFEYKTAVPKGFVRVLGKLAELCDAGLPVHFFGGNHDMWTFGYLRDEIGMKIYKKPLIRTIGEKTFYIAHGDGLGPGDRKYKMLKFFFTSKICQRLLAGVHPDIALAVGNRWSRKSRLTNGHLNAQRKYSDAEWLVIHAREVLRTQNIDFFIFGHRHKPANFSLTNTGRFINLGDWINYNSYASYNGKDVQLHFFENDGSRHVGGTAADRL